MICLDHSINRDKKSRSFSQLYELCPRTYALVQGYLGFGLNYLMRFAHQLVIKQRSHTKQLLGTEILVRSSPWC